MSSKQAPRIFLFIFQCLCLLSLVLLVIRFEEHVINFGVLGTAAQLYFVVFLIFLQPIFYVFTHGCNAGSASFLSEAYAASSLPLISGRFEKISKKNYYFSWFLIAFALLPAVLYKKWSNGDFLAYVPVNLLAALVAYTQIMILFEAIVELIKKGKA